MPVRGAFGRLRSLIGQLRAVQGGALTKPESRLMQEALAATREEVAACFLYQQDPDGVAWQPRKTVYGDYRDTNPILFDLLSFMQFEISDGKIKVTNSKYYAFFHQTGTRYMVARRFLPSAASPGRLPDRLKAAAARSVRAAFASPGLGRVLGYALDRAEQAVNAADRRVPEDRAEIGRVGVTRIGT